MKPTFVQRLTITLLTNASGTHQLDVVVPSGRVVVRNLNDFVGRLAAIWTGEKRFLCRHGALRVQVLQIGSPLVESGPDL